MASGTDWQGRVGREWADKADALDRLLGPVGEAGIAALGDVSGRKVLDLGCGSGATALALAAHGAQVTGVDISTNLLARARERDTDRTVDFVLADASTYIPKTPPEVLHSRCGVMFFDDQIAAWSHLKAQMHPGAPIALTVWRDASENEWAFLPLSFAAKVLGEKATRLRPPQRPRSLRLVRSGAFRPDPGTIRLDRYPLGARRPRGNHGNRRRRRSSHTRCRIRHAYRTIGQPPARN